MGDLLFSGIPGEDALSPVQRDFLDECRAMVGVASDELLSPIGTSASLESFRGAYQLEATLVEPGNDRSIEASVSEGEIVVAMAEEEWSYHWHFAPKWNDVYEEVPGRPWTTLAVDFIAELLRGEVRVRVTWRGNHLLKVHAEVVGSHGDSLTAGTTGSLSPRALNFLAKRRVEEHVVRFGR